MGYFQGPTVNLPEGIRNLYPMVSHQFDYKFITTLKPIAILYTIVSPSFYGVLRYDPIIPGLPMTKNRSWSPHAPSTRGPAQLRGAGPLLCHGALKAATPKGLMITGGLTMKNGGLNGIYPLVN